MNNFAESSIFLFTDGSSRIIEDVNHISSAYVIIDPTARQTMVYDGSTYESHSKSVNDQSELEALYHGLNRIDMLKRLHKIRPNRGRVTINVITDAEYVRKTFTQYAFTNHKRYGEDGIWRKKDGKKIAHHDLIKYIFYNFIMDKKNYNIKFYHINSHITKTEMQKRYQKFCNKNQIRISMEGFLRLVTFNKRCDDLAKETLRSGIGMEIDVFAKNNLLKSMKHKNEKPKYKNRKR